MKTRSFKFIGIAGLFAASLLTSCSSEPKEVEKLTFLQTVTLTAEDATDKYSIVQGGDAHSGQFFSRTDSAVHYGMGPVFTIPDSLLQKDIRVCVDMWVRSSDPAAKQAYAVALHNGGDVLSWTELDMSKYIKTPNTWVNIKDSITVPGGLITKPGMVIKSFAFNPTGKGILDSDDISLTYKKVEKSIE